jgi:hypothetical protein
MRRDNIRGEADFVRNGVADHEPTAEDRNRRWKRGKEVVRKFDAGYFFDLGQLRLGQCCPNRFDVSDDIRGRKPGSEGHFGQDVFQAVE